VPTPYSKQQATINLRSAVAVVTGRLIEMGYAIKARDGREPGKAEKERAEERLAALWRRIFRKQRARLLERLESEFPERKSIKVDLSFMDLDLDDEDRESLIKLLTNMLRGGISLFGQRSKPDVDYTLTNQQAAEQAREYVFDLVRGINDTTRDALRDAVSSFVQTPGMTIGDLADAIAPHFGEMRAERIAITETTRAYAEGEIMAGEQLRQEWPDVKVIKIWMTNMDDLVCPICAPLDGMEVELGQDFDGIDQPPAHPGCRCFLETSTALAELGE
jgi:hypothetical protein